ncbi:hypothetical protein GCM10007874_25610 [Labrys miyagiensis]|uniref:Uncharacterized protein n=1 Tax=Labrys miyagiensis TaxID=346912 RepID=A0ABQ6CLE2_9HYPH|nr:hypothetical protein GCM10007874_25610 [Labrys miyagiensis]
MDFPAPPEADAMTIGIHGAQHFPSALDEADLARLEAALAGLPDEQAGLRLHGLSALQPFLTPSGALGLIASTFLGENCRAVRAVLFARRRRPTGRSPGTRTAPSPWPSAARWKALAPGR